MSLLHVTQTILSYKTLFYLYCMYGLPKSATTNYNNPVTVPTDCS